MWVIVRAVLANSEYENSSDDLLIYLKEQIKDGEFYKLTPKPGSMMHSAIDWQLIANIASVISIAGFLWTAYEKFIVRNKDKRNNSLLFVQFQIGDKTAQFKLGEEHCNHKEIFIRNVAETVYTMKVNNSSEDIELQKKYIETSEIWTKLV